MDDTRHIENLIYRYAELIDSGDLEGVASLFKSGEIISSAHDTRIQGYENVLSLYRNSCRIYEESGTPQTRHLTTNVIIDIADDAGSALARSYYTVIQATSTLPLQVIISGRYKDNFVKRNDKWQFASREMFIDLVGDCSAHLLYEL